VPIEVEIYKKIITNMIGIIKTTSRLADFSKAKRLNYIVNRVDLNVAFRIKKNLTTGKRMLYQLLDIFHLAIRI